MNLKNTGIYLILGGIAIYLLFFIKTIIGFIFTRPLLGFGFILIIAGLGLLVYNLIQEPEKIEKSDPSKNLKG